MCVFLTHYQALEVRLDEHRCIVAVAAHVHLKSPQAPSIVHLLACGAR